MAPHKLSATLASWQEYRIYLWGERVIIRVAVGGAGGMGTYNVMWALEPCGTLVFFTLPRVYIGTGKYFNQWAEKSTHKSDKWMYWEPSKWEIKNYLKITRYPDLWNGGWMYKYYLDQTNVLIHTMNQTVVTHQVHETVLVQQMQFPSLHLPNIKPASLHCTSFHHDCLELHLPLGKIQKGCYKYA